MALTAAQHAARAGKLGGSDMGCLMRGEREDIYRLWQEKIGDAQPKDLSGNFQVRLGEISEPLNIEWFERKQEQPVTRRGEVVTHLFLPWACCTLDGWVEQWSCPIECKHTSERDPIETVIERFQPQMQWQMEVTGAEQCALSIIRGNLDPVVEFIKRNEEYAEELVKRGTIFMAHVQSRTPPVELPAVPAPIDATAVYDMTGNNEWALHAGRWLELKVSADACRDAEKVLKAMVPKDAKKVWGHDVQITRNRAGSLSLRELQE